MFIIQPRKSSIFRTVFLIIMLEIAFVEKSFSNQNTCEFRNTRNISYFTFHSQDVNWTEAWRQCNNNGYTLPVICNQHEQDAFTTFLKENRRYSPAWTSGRKISFDDWKWIDGQSLSSTNVIKPVPDKLYIRAHFNQANKYRAGDPRHELHYLCHYSNTSDSCKNGNVIQVTKGCVRPSNDQRLWFGARNQCVNNGGDLVIVDDKDIVTLMNSIMLNATHNYWIGLENNNSWRWMRHKAEQADDAGEDVKFTNWTNGVPHSSGECISIDASNGGWNSVNCTRRNNVICQTSFGSDETTSRMSSSFTTSRATSSSKTPSTKSMPLMSNKSSSTWPSISTALLVVSATTRSMSSVSESATQRMTYVDTQALLYSGIGAGIVILIIFIIIIIVLILRCTRKSSKDTNQSKVKNNSEQNRLELSPNEPATSPAYAPASQPVAGADDSLGVYAEISLAPRNQSEDEAKIQQPGIVYAALEFKKEPTYLEPGQKKSDQTKPGPMGDICAVPDAKSRTATSPGNETASLPTKVTQQDDVYALPVKNSTVPTANHPVGGIYSNL